MRVGGGGTPPTRGHERRLAAGTLVVATRADDANRLIVAAVYDPYPFDHPWVIRPGLLVDDALLAVAAPCEVGSTTVAVLGLVLRSLA